ncbi:hypothetical protein [Stenoxybacter acetivorans]|uniref:hypothetical protein n=1 Tax=Stenoxybacter acetivorans TaxID=422441 RepID=UPI00056298E6|nr:hypothetical protein [Stenoxybacter acetivorans]
MSMPPVRQSRLQPHADEILAMRSEGKSEQEIVAWLMNEKAVKVSQQALNNFIKKQNNPADESIAKSAEVSGEISKIDVSALLPILEQYSESFTDDLDLDNRLTEVVQQVLVDNLKIQQQFQQSLSKTLEAMEKQNTQLNIDLVICKNYPRCLHFSSK